MNKNNIKAILFDLDGTLFRSEMYHFIAWNEALKKFSIIVSPEKYILYTGKSAEWIEDDIRAMCNNAFQKGELINEKNKIFMDLFGNLGWEDGGLMPYAKEAIEYFYNKSFQLAICTSGGREETIFKLQSASIEKYFDAIFTADDVEFCKPAPDIYLSAISKFQLKDNECLAIEDTESGLTAAKEAGAFCFAIPTEHSRKQNFEKADKVLASLKDLIDFFN